MIGYTLEEKVAVIEFQRPEARNALNPEIMDGLEAAFDRAEADGVFVIVLTGQGTVFSAGADLRSGAVLDKNFMERVIRFYRRVEAMKQILVAAGAEIGADHRDAHVAQRPVPHRQ